MPHGGLMQPDYFGESARIGMVERKGYLRSLINGQVGVIGVGCAVAYGLEDTTCRLYYAPCFHVPRTDYRKNYGSLYPTIPL
jgi:hypothetical protein